MTATSILQRIVPSLAAVVVNQGPNQGSAKSTAALIDEAESMGLLGRSSVTSVSRRFHPLLRGFLQRRLESSTSPAERRQMHLRLARAAGSADWHTACHHLIEAGEYAEAMRVLSDSATHALGAGSLGAATNLLPRIQGVPASPAILALQARSLAVTDPSRALTILASIDLNVVSTTVLALVRQTRAYAFFRSGERDGVFEVLDQLIRDETTPEALRAISGAQLMMLKASIGRSTMRNTAESLTGLARTQVANGQHYFAAISYHNALVCSLAQGEYREAIEYGKRALSEFEATDGYRFEAQSTHAGLYVALMELADLVGAQAEMEAVVAFERDADADAYADIASVRAVVGDADGAMRLLATARRRLATGWTDLAATASVVWAEALVHIVVGESVAASVILETLPETTAFDPGHASAQALHAAVAATLANRSDSVSLATEALKLARTQGAWSYEARANILVCASEERREALRTALHEGANRGMLVLLEMADVLGQSLYLLDPVPDEIIDSIHLWPARWLPVLRRALVGSHRANAMASAQLLVRFGTPEDAPRLAAFDQLNKKHLKGFRHARLLAERVSDRLYICDLGRVEYRIGNRVIPTSETRRKAAALSAYLVTRPHFTATREQVLEDIWPESDPRAAANSLHQTLYFLRRDIDPWYDDDSSASYVTFEGDMLWLSSSLVFPESAAFDAKASEAMLAEASINDQLRALNVYRGRFAPDFEYEEWSLAWRDRLHANYLGLVDSTFKRLIGVKRHDEAIRIAQVALAIDSSALDIEEGLVCAYSSIGHDSAASRQYAHFARAYQAEFGLSAPPLRDLCQVTGDKPWRETRPEPHGYVDRLIGGPPE